MSESKDEGKKLELFRKRKALKSSLTRRRNDITLLMTSVDNHTEVKSKFPTFQETLGKFLEAQDEYQEILSNIEEAERSEEYGEEVENTSTQFQVQVKKWLDQTAATPENNIEQVEASSDKLIQGFTQCMDKLLKQQTSSVNNLLLPKTEMPIYDGNPIDYPDFIRSFENLVESQTDQDSRRLYFLVQYTSGEVRELMSSCLSMPATEGYRQARRLLKRNYGQNYKIAEAYTSKITDGPSIKADDGINLRKFAVSLSSCANIMKEIGFSSKVNSPDTLKKIISRLPYVLRRKWRSKADYISEEEDREILLEDVVRFVEAEARAATHPIFGSIGDTNTKLTDKKRPQTQKTKAFTSQSDQSSHSNSKQHTSICVYCGNDHSLFHCSAFKQLSVQERSQFARDKWLCFNCLVPKHRAKECRRKPACGDCSGKHVTLLHMPHYNNDAHPRQQSTEQGVANDAVGSCSRSATNDPSSKVALPILPVKVKAKNGPAVMTYAFLDNGSDSTFCTSSLVQSLGIKGRKTKLSLTTLEKENSVSDCELVSMQVYNVNEDVFFDLPSVFTRPTLPVTRTDIPSQKDIASFDHLQHITIHNIDAPVGLLIGNDNAHVIQPTEIIKSDGTGPYAVKTAFGWAINGPLGSLHSQNHKANFIRVQQKDDLDSKFRDFYNMEFNDLKASDIHCEMSQEDKRALKLMENSVQMIDGHYQLGLPWKKYPPDLPNNYALAEHRLNLLKRRLKKDPDLLAKYSDFMANLLDKGYAQPVPSSEIDANLVWYLPHHPVFHPRKPEKLRVVFDCSARYGTFSLNNSLLQGPDLTNSLVGVLTRFRQEPVAVIADIEAMFHQVHVEPKDRDVLRYLWWPEGKLYMRPLEYRMTVHLFGATSSPSCCNFALRKTADDNKSHFDSNITGTVKRNFYVDDLLKSVESEEAAINLTRDLCLLLSKGGFKLTKWISNSSKVTESIDHSRRAVSLDLESHRQRALGMQWNVMEDTLGFKVSPDENSSTRRGMLSIISSVYDPLGLACPFVLCAKILLQDLCRLKLRWDDQIPAKHKDLWERWLSDLPNLNQLNVSRCFLPSSFASVTSAQLHHFSDASDSGYGSASYLRLSNQLGEVFCSLVMSKSRVVPLKQTTIPRLELAAATLSVKLDTMIRKEIDIPISESWFWTDSTSVLKYIRNTETRFKTFVANRLAVIHDGSCPRQWKYVASRQNPADDASRGLTSEALLTSKRWFSGPEFLWHTDDLWPEQPLLSAADGDDREIKKDCTSNLARADDLPPLVNAVQRFSSWYRLKKCIALCLHYKSNLLEASRARKQGQVKFCEEKRPIFLTVEEMENSQREILRCVQQQHFGEEVRCLERSNPVKKSSSIAKLSPILKDGLLCVGGRLQQASVPVESKHQIILPKDSHVTLLIIQYYHQLSGHSGREYVLSLLRSKFWVIKGNSAVRKVLSQCFKCRQLQSRPLEQKMADLPDDRITSQHPFSSVGIDFFGPILIKRGRSIVKRYGCVFTCLTIRAIHIEITETLNTDSFINALRRFMARRGNPSLIRTDNGRNFVGSEKELKEMIQKWNKHCIHQFLLQRSVKWIFNPPYASHFGGVWERCIRTIKKILKSLLGEQVLNEEGLSTFMCEVEAIVNGRPLTKSSDDPKDASSLTPNDLLLLQSPVQLPPGIFAQHDTYVKRRWRQVQYLADQFWRRWIKEYLPLLQRRQKWLTQNPNMAVGDLVLLVDESTPRGQWAKGLVQEVFPDQKGIVRKAKIKTAAGIFCRNIQKLCMLERSV